MFFMLTNLACLAVPRKRPYLSSNPMPRMKLSVTPALVGLIGQVLFVHGKALVRSTIASAVMPAAV